MTNKLLYGKTLESYDDVDIDDLLSKLTEDEIKELNDDLDPDNSLLPPSQRCRDQTTKLPTGPFDREKLINFLIEEAKLKEDWEDAVPFEKIIRGKVFVPKNRDEINRQELAELGFDVEFDEEIREVLSAATEEELVDLASILGFTGMLNQVQFHAGIENKAQECGGFQGVAKSEKCKLFEELPPNDTDVDESIKQLKADDPKLTNLNLNNIKDITYDQFSSIADSLTTNKSLKQLHMAATGLNNKKFEPFLDSLTKNSTLEVLTLDSNLLMSDMLVKLMKAVNHADSAISEVHLANQRQQTLGVQIEQQLTNLVCENPRLLRFGLDFETSDAKVRVREALTVHMDKCTRQLRIQ